MRAYDMTKDLDDPYGSLLIKNIDEVSANNVDLVVPTRIDLISEIPPNELSYAIIRNRLINSIYVTSIEVLNSNEIRSIETKGNKR